MLSPTATTATATTPAATPPTTTTRWPWVVPGVLGMVGGACVAVAGVTVAGRYGLLHGLLDDPPPEAGSSMTVHVAPTQATPNVAEMMTSLHQKLYKSSPKNA